MNLLVNVIFPSLLTAFSWGITPFFDKKSLISLENDYNLALLLKFILGGIISCIFLLFLYINQSPRKELKLRNIHKSFKTSFLSALFLIIGYYYFFKALSYENHTSLVVLIAYIIPIILTAVIAYFMLNEKMNLGMVSGIIISIIGIYIFVCYNK
tara:strand:+ start:349 stop:813 length:465 start_codon:yes stop_codon:yes gene_type:complete